MQTEDTGPLLDQTAHRRKPCVHQHEACMTDNKRQHICRRERRTAGHGYFWIRLFYGGKPKLGGFALVVGQTFVGGDIGHGKTDESQRLACVRDLWVIHELV
jgi:hypothetical protein